MAWWVVLGAALAATTPPTSPPTTAPATPPATVPATTVPGAVDPLGCAALVHDPSGELDVGVVTAAAGRAAQALGADLHVRAERDVDGGLDARMVQLEAQCPTWWAGADRAPELVVVMYSSSDREASVFYGPGQSDDLEFRWEHAVDEMGARFADGDYTAGVVAGLDALREDAPTTYEPTASPTHYDDDSPSSPGVPAVVWLALIALVAVAVVRVASFLRTGEWSTGDGDSDESSRHTSRRRMSSWSSSTSRQSSSSSSASSTRPRRSGGGTKKW
jgi:hypothetical protein